MEKIFLVRMDGIGDLALTLPVDMTPFLDPERGTVHGEPRDLVWIVADGLGFVALHANPQRECMQCPKSFSSGFLYFLKLLKTERPHRIIFFQAPWWAYLASWIAQIRLRQGRLSKWYSFIFLNRGFRQSRIQAEKSELEYNWEIIHQAFGFKVHISPPSLVLLRDVTRTVAQSLLEKWNLAAGKYYVIHPGMAGSALNWPAEMYSQLIDRVLAETDLNVVVTGTRGDDRFLTPLKPHFQTHARVRWTQSALSAVELLYMLKLSRGVIAPSTGVLHLAAACQVPTIGIYCPVKSMHPTRWGAIGEKVKILIPEVECPASTKCLRKGCPEYDCMMKISVDTVFERLAKATSTGPQARTTHRNDPSSTN